MLNRTYDRIRSLFEKAGGYLSTRALLNERVSTIHIKEMLDAGDIEKISHGNYWGLLLHLDKPENYRLIEACMTNHRAVICGLSACRYHGLLKTDPKALFIATQRTDRGSMQLNFDVSRHYFSVEKYSDDVETWKYHDIVVKVYGMDRSIVDAIRLSDGKDKKLVSEAVKAYKEHPEADFDKCVAYADSMRVGRIVREALGLPKSDAGTDIN